MLAAEPLLRVVAVEVQHFPRGVELIGLHLPLDWQKLADKTRVAPFRGHFHAGFFANRHEADLAAAVQIEVDGKIITLTRIIQLGLGADADFQNLFRLDARVGRPFGVV